jgi:hypothetical protein
MQGEYIQDADFCPPNDCWHGEQQVKSLILQVIPVALLSNRQDPDFLGKAPGDTQMDRVIE